MSTYNPSGYSGGGAVLARDEKLAAVVDEHGNVVLARQEQKLVVQPELQANQINVFIALDASGSMSGARWRSAVSGCQSLLSQLFPTDVVGVFTFNAAVQQVHVGIKRDWSLIC